MTVQPSHLLVPAAAGGHDATPPYAEADIPWTWSPSARGVRDDLVSCSEAIRLVGHAVIPPEWFAPLGSGRS